MAKVLIVYYTRGGNTAYEAMVDWGDSLSRPETLLLTGKKDGLDPYSRRHQEHLFALEDREETNLLYVAVSRAQQLLYISGTAPARKKDSAWYDAICAQYAIDPVDIIDRRCLHEAQTPPNIIATPVKPHDTVSTIDPRLSKTIPPIHTQTEIAPSRTVNRSDAMQSLDEDGRRRGLLIHAMLERLSQLKPPSLERLAQQYGLAEQNTLFQSCLVEVQQVLQAPHLQMLYDPQHYQTAYNEVPISYEQNGRMVYGIIDRLVINEGQVLLIDYKTHRVDAVNLQDLAETYKPQLALYVTGINKLWPECVIKPQLLFTHSATLLPMAI